LDADLVTDTVNFLASQYWEGQLLMVVQNGSVQLLFDNTGDPCYGYGFEMFTVLEANFCPNTFLLHSPHSFQYPPNSSGHASILEGTSSLLQSNHRIVFVSKQKDISVATMDYLVSDAESTCMSLLSLTLMATLVSCHR